MGDSDTSGFHRLILHEQLAEIEQKWESKNNLRKTEYVQDSTNKSVVSSLVFGLIGAALAGPSGALIGGLLGGGGKAAESYENSC